MIDQAVLDAGRVRVDVSGPVLSVTLDRPEQLNAQTPATWRALADIGRALPPDVRVVVVRGAGRSFSAGLDRALLTPQGRPDEPSLLELSRRPRPDIEAAIEQFQAAFTWWSTAPVVTVAAVRGNAVGAGFQLALACDLRVLAEDARFAMREPSLGLVPDLAGTWPLVAAVGPARALEICATGRWVSAVEAGQIGLATAVVPGPNLDAAVADLVDALLATPEAALRETLMLLRAAATRTPSEQRAAERAAQARLLSAMGERPAR
ncbi:MAG: enoyl-CoA hydratase/isomerase family protein [Actinomycetales bacterium]